MTLILRERDVQGLVSMRDVIPAVEEAFRRQGGGLVDNAARTRSRGGGGVLNAMHACLPYLGRAGVKCYMSSRAGARFVFVLFDMADANPLAVMGADTLGRLRTGAASGVATKFLYGRSSARLAVCGSGKQALTQVLGVAAVTSVAEVRAWSPDAAHREEFCKTLARAGYAATPFPSPAAAAGGADVVSTVTSSRAAFIEPQSLEGVRHVNACGSNQPDRAEVSPEALEGFGSVVVDDLHQARTEYGDLIQGVAAGRFAWTAALELKEVVAGRVHPKSPTLFKSGGVALEDVAVGSVIYDKALKSGRFSGGAVDMS